jgi:hypothetical protein
MWEGLQWTLKKFHGYIPWPRIFFDIDYLHRQPLAVTDLTLLFLVRFAGRETKGVELHLDAGRRQVWPRKLPVSCLKCTRMHQVSGSKHHLVWQ